ncbi:hypothetical protein KDA00_01785 [Candidatus Saccharibacteria bacterium]|nr:hypothetical protein [Candidatus Saccharibacteria bacterium]
MVGAAIWIISAVVVISAVYLVGILFLGTLVSETGRKVLGFIAIAILVGVVWLYNDANKSNQVYEARKMNNAPLQAQCIEQANTKALELGRAAIANGTFTESYRQQLDNALRQTKLNCQIKYPVN